MPREKAILAARGFVLRKRKSCDTVSCHPIVKGVEPAYAQDGEEAS